MTLQVIAIVFATVDVLLQNIKMLQDSVLTVIVWPLFQWSVRYNYSGCSNTIYNSKVYNLWARDES